MKLWNVTVEYEILVATDDDGTERQAEDIARDAVREESVPDILVREITDDKQIPHAWKDALVYGPHEGDLTPSQVLRDQG